MKEFKFQKFQEMIMGQGTGDLILLNAEVQTQAEITSISKCDNQRIWGTLTTDLPRIKAKGLWSQRKLLLGCNIQVDYVNAGLLVLI